VRYRKFLKETSDSTSPAIEI